MQDHYEIDQTLVPEAFLAIYVVRGRPTLGRAELQARHEFAETLASQVAAMCPSLAPDDVDGQTRVLRQVRAGLVTEPAQVSADEARWVVGRVAELLDFAGEAVGAVVGAADGRTGDGAGR